MSELQELIASGNSSIVPDHTLSAPRLMEWAEAETEAAEAYLRSVARAAAGLPEETRGVMHARAVDNLRDAPFAFGTAAFEAWALSAGAGPFLLWLSLRVRHPGMTRGGAAAFLCGPDADEIMRAVWDLWGYRREKKAPNQPRESIAAAAASGVPASGISAAGISETGISI